MGTADTNIFTAPGKAIFGAVNAGKKISQSMNEFHEGLDQVKESLDGMKADLKRQERKIAVTQYYQKLHYNEMSPDEQRALDESANLQSNKLLCTIMGVLMGVIATVCGIIYGSWEWYISFICFPILMVMCYFLSKIAFVGYFAATFNFAVVFGAIIDGIIKLVSFFVDIPSFWYILVPFLGAIIGVARRIRQAKNEGFTCIPLTEEEQEEVDSIDYE